MPIYMVIERGRHDFALFLLDRGADIHAKNKVSAITFITSLLI
jgi:hypothetical protein